MAAVAWSEAEPGLITGEAVALDVRPTGYLLRAAAAAIDWATYVLLFIGIFLLLTVTTGDLDQALITALTTVAGVFCFVVAPLVVELATRGRSLGNLAVGARIVRDDGGAIQFRHALVRALTGVIELFATVGGLAAFVGLLNSRSKRLGDLIAGTYSQNERVAEVREVVYAMPHELLAWAALADVAKLPDRLSRRIAQFLRQSPHLTPAARAGLSAELAHEASAYVSPLPAVDAELLLVAVAAMRRDRDYRALLLERERLERLRPQLTGLTHGFPER